MYPYYFIVNQINWEFAKWNRQKCIFSKDYLFGNHFDGVMIKNIWDIKCIIRIRKSMQDRWQDREGKKSHNWSIKHSTEGRVGISLNGLTLPHFCAHPKSGSGFPASYVMAFSMFSELRWEVIDSFVNIGGIVTN